MTDRQRPATGNKSVRAVYKAEEQARRREIGECELAVRNDWKNPDLRHRLANAYIDLADFQLTEREFAASISTRHSVIDLLKDTRVNCADTLLLRMLQATQLNARGFTLREIGSWDAAEKDYLEIMALLEPETEVNQDLVSLMAMAQDGIGDIRDTDDPEAQDAAWERARALFQSCLHMIDRGLPGTSQRERIENLLQDVIDKQAEVRGETSGDGPTDDMTA